MLFVMQKTSGEDLMDRIQLETHLWETKKEKVLKWGDSIDMRKSLAPTGGSRVPQ
ncbi:large subunit ribosomal protein L31 [Nematocida displodere]|uniref:Large subunit ribosomal protein L31 n=1 Tax=Nematocida displodere TaxID=1805483 RepID=A0A177EII4_9MICR|nr:large subunit ribosomal protein L31 [Nematocida displodere]